MSVANQYCSGGGFPATVCLPAAVAVDFNDNVYVSSMQRSEIAVLRAASTEVQRTIPSSIGSGAKMAFDALGGAYLAVPASTGVYRMEPQDVGGAISPAFGNIAGSFAGPVQNPAQWLNNVRGIGLDATRSVLYVCDTSNARVLAFQANVSNFATAVYGQPDFDSRMPNNGSVQGSSLYGPSDVGVDDDGGLYVVDTGNSRVLYFPVDRNVASAVFGQKGRMDANLPNRGGVSADSLAFPTGVAIDSSSGLLYVADTMNNRVLRYDVSALRNTASSEELSTSSTRTTLPASSLTSAVTTTTARLTTRTVPTTTSPATPTTSLSTMSTTTPVRPLLPVSTSTKSANTVFSSSAANPETTRPVAESLSVGVIVAISLASAVGGGIVAVSVVVAIFILRRRMRSATAAVPLATPLVVQDRNSHAGNSVDAEDGFSFDDL